MVNTSESIGASPRQGGKCGNHGKYSSLYSGRFLVSTSLSKSTSKKVSPTRKGLPNNIKGKKNMHACKKGGQGKFSCSHQSAYVLVISSLERCLID
jgi:hypothetical protein